MRHRRLILVALLALALNAALLAAHAARRPATPGQGLAHAPALASYALEVTLDPAAKAVRGQGLITYTNPSADSLRELWLRLYLKAFSADDTVWMGEAGGGHRGFSAEDSRGDIGVTRFAVGGADLMSTSTISVTLPALTLGARMAFWLQTIAQTIGLFG